MEMMAIGLIVFAIVLFILCLYLAVWATRRRCKNVLMPAPAQHGRTKVYCCKITAAVFTARKLHPEYKGYMHRGKDETEWETGLRGRWYKHQQ